MKLISSVALLVVVLFCLGSTTSSAAPNWAVGTNSAGSSAATNTNLKVEYCSSGTPYFELKTVSFSGSFVQGKKIKMDGSLIVKKEFTIGSVGLEVVIDKASVYKGDLPLPKPQKVVKGTQPLNFEEPFPQTLPKGSLQLISTLKDTAGKIIQCFKVTLTNK